MVGGKVRSLPGWPADPNGSVTPSSRVSLAPPAVEDLRYPPRPSLLALGARHRFRVLTTACERQALERRLCGGVSVEGGGEILGNAQLPGPRVTFELHVDRLTESGSGGFSRGLVDAQTAAARAFECAREARDDAIVPSDGARLAPQEERATHPSSTGPVGFASASRGYWNGMLRYLGVLLCLLVLGCGGAPAKGPGAARPVASDTARPAAAATPRAPKLLTVQRHGGRTATLDFLTVYRDGTASVDKRYGGGGRRKEQFRITSERLRVIRRALRRLTRSLPTRKAPAGSVTFLLRASGRVYVAQEGALGRRERPLFRALDGVIAGEGRR
jgi:hypothetical protein